MVSNLCIKKILKYTDRIQSKFRFWLYTQVKGGDPMSVSSISNASLSSIYSTYKSQSDLLKALEASDSKEDSDASSESSFLNVITNLNTYATTAAFKENISTDDVDSDDSSSSSTSISSSEMLNNLFGTSSDAYDSLVNLNTYAKNRLFESSLTENIDSSSIAAILTSSLTSDYEKLAKKVSAAYEKSNTLESSTSTFNLSL